MTELKSGRNRLVDFTKAFCGDTHGLILPYVTMLLVVIIGVSVLALDGARYMSLQTELQNGADALALAGAAELDRLPDSRARAVRAINGLLANRTSFGNERTVQVSRIEFYERLPASDTQAMSNGALASDGTSARYVSVSVRPVSLNTILPAAFFGGATLISAGAASVAGSDQVLCQAAPLYVCNPYEVSGMSYEQASGALQDAVANPSMRRRMLRLRQYGDRNEPLAATDYGFLDGAAAGSEPGDVIDAIATDRPRACFVQNGVNFRAGTLPTVREAFNVRFDIYEGAMSGRQYDRAYRPSSNVRKGYVGGACNARSGPYWPIGIAPGQVTGLLLDREWFLGSRMGMGNWDFATYWQVNHGGDGRAPPSVGGNAASNSNLPSRYEVYRYEIDRGYVTDRSPGGESGAPVCYGGGASSEVSDRRAIYSAIVNCQSLGLVGGVQSNVPVAAFGKLFLTLPLQPTQTDLYVELIGLVRPGDDGNFEMVQLYR